MKTSTFALILFLACHFGFAQQNKRRIVWLKAKVESAVGVANDFFSWAVLPGKI